MKATIFIALSGKHYCFSKQKQFLINIQTHPKISDIVLVNTSNNEAFKASVTSLDCNYKELITETHLMMKRATDASKKISNKQAIHGTIAFIYNKIFEYVKTDFVWLIEDDNIPEPHHIDLMFDLYNFAKTPVLSPYYYHYGKLYNIWLDSCAKQPLLPEISSRMYAEGGGFGSCLLNLNDIGRFRFEESEQGDRTIWGADVQFFLENGPIITSQHLECRHLREEEII